MVTQRIRMLAGVVLSALPLVVNACRTDPNAPSGIQSVAIAQAAARIDALGDTVRLSATARNASGGAATVSFVWSALDPGIATVDGQGLVTAVANGAARIRAAVQGGTAADTATVTVEQKAATITVTPGRDTLTSGSSKRYTAQARDKRNREMTNAAFTWSSADTGVATVDGTGLVTARAKGTVLIRARADTATGSVDLTVRVVNLVLQRDTALSGTLQVGRLEVPAGRRLTAAGDLLIAAEGDIVLDGTVSGDCIQIKLRGRGELRMNRGVVTNACSDTTRTGKPLTLLVDGAMTLDSVTITGAGAGVTVANDSALAASPISAGSGVSPATGPRGLASAVPLPCQVSGIVSGGHAARGVDGSPKGTDGADATVPTVMACSGTTTVAALRLEGGQGGFGGIGTSTTSTPALGGHGGDGSDVILRVGGGDLVIDLLLAVVAGSGGYGGRATAGPPRPGDPAQATGGNGGDSGVPLVRVGGAIGGPSALDVHILAGEGGLGDAATVDGLDATSTAAARPSGNATAIGGKGGNAARGQALRLIGGIVQANAVGVPVTALGGGGLGNLARATSGKGGGGNHPFPNGAKGGDLHAQGGAGGDSFVQLPDGSHLPGGHGGRSILEDARGGTGHPGCDPQDLHAGGLGGDGGNATGGDGKGGRSPTAAAKDGDVEYRAAGNGENGADGAGPGIGGDAGTDGAVVLGQLFDDGMSFTPGGPGAACIFPLNSTFTVVSDPGGHNPFLNVTGINAVALQFNPNTTFTLQISGVSLTGNVPQGSSPAPAPGGAPSLTAAVATIPISGTGGGTISGRTATATLTNGNLETDAQGKLTKLTGTFTFGVGGELPGGQPVSYSLTATVPTPAPVNSRLPGANDPEAP